MTITVGRHDMMSFQSILINIYFILRFINFNFNKSFYSTFGKKVNFGGELSSTTELPRSSAVTQNIEDLEKQLLDVLDQLAGKYEEK